MNLPRLLARYSVAGAINGIVCYAVVFACMATGIGAGTSNGLGYLAGLITSFLQSRHWVFRSTGGVVDDWLRFLVVFALAYCMNFLALHALLNRGVNAYLAQLASCSVYVAVSFVLNSCWVFRKRASDKGR
ncbi:MAG: GtrA family protein [Proteobacteria bacterium]|nr:GtrA family protein [Pseudomonadota bacterium]